MNIPSNSTAAPNHALQRTAPAVTLAASAAAFPPTMQPARQPPQSLSLGALGASTSLVRTAAFAFLVSAAAFAADADWKQQSGRFAVFQAPASMVRDTNSVGIDTIVEAYVSRDLSLTFDSEVRNAPPTLQAEFDRTITAWAAQRKAERSASNYVEGGGAIHGSDDPKDSSGRRYYLYLGFAAGERTFAIHVRFASLDRLDDIERVLRSIKFNAK